MVTGNWILCSYFTCRLIPDGASSINQVYRKYGKMGVGSKIVRIIRLESKRWWQISRQSCRRNCPRRSAREAACNTDLICFRKHTFHAAVGGGLNCLCVAGRWWQKAVTDWYDLRRTTIAERKATPQHIAWSTAMPRQSEKTQTVSATEILSYVCLRQEGSN